VEEMKIKGMKKSALRNKFSFEKSWDAVDIINKIIGKFVVDGNFEGNKLRISICNNREPGPMFDIKEVVDELHNFGNEGYSTDVFIGKGKIILVVNSRVDRQREICETVFEFADFEEVKNE
jgi:hypothetical protein